MQDLIVTLLAYVYTIVIILVKGFLCIYYIVLSLGLYIFS